jgi:hypothetical protein
LPEPLMHFFDQLGADIVVIIEDSALSKQRGEPERIGEVVFHGLVPMITNIRKPFADPENFMMVGLSLDEDDHVDIAVGRDGSPGA